MAPLGRCPLAYADDTCTNAVQRRMLPTRSSTCCVPCATGLGYHAKKNAYMRWSGKTRHAEPHARDWVWQVLHTLCQSVEEGPINKCGAVLEEQGAATHA